MRSLGAPASHQFIGRGADTHATRIVDSGVGAGVWNGHTPAAREKKCRDPE